MLAGATLGDDGTFSGGTEVLLAIRYLDAQRQDGLLVGRFMNAVVHCEGEPIKRSVSATSRLNGGKQYNRAHRRLVTATFHVGSR